MANDNTDNNNGTPSKSGAPTFVLSDESLNSYGFVVLTDGIDTTAFERNPVMLYMHNRDGNVIGRWENIRKEDNRLLADAVFDDSSELAATVKKQVENGFLRCCSIGIEQLATEARNGVETVVKSRLIEVSIVDIPSNQNAVKLFRKSGGYVYSLKALQGEENTDKTEDLRTALIDLLGLESGADDKSIIEAVKKAVEGEKTAEDAVDEAILGGYVDPKQRDIFLGLARTNRLSFEFYVKGQKDGATPQILEMIDKAVVQRKIMSCETAIYRRVGEQMGVKYLQDLLFTLRPMAKPMDMIRGGAAFSDRSNWRLDDYRKFAPHELERDPELYARLVKEAKGEDVAVHSLEWYRRNNPEYLREHPQFYRDLLEKERKEKNKNNK